MSARRPNGGRRVQVRLSDVPLDLREQVATELARRWRLTGTDYALFLLCAFRPQEDPSIMVPAEKAERALTGRRPLGTMPEDLAVVLRSRPLLMR